MLSDTEIGKKPTKGAREDIWSTKKALTKSGSQHSEQPHSNTLLELKGLGYRLVLQTCSKHIEILQNNRKDRTGGKRRKKKCCRDTLSLIATCHQCGRMAEWKRHTGWQSTLELLIPVSWKEILWLSITPERNK